MIIATVIVTREMDDETGEIVDGIAAFDACDESLDEVVALGMLARGQQLLNATEGV